MTGGDGTEDLEVVEILTQLWDADDSGLRNVDDFYADAATDDDTDGM